MGNVTKALGNLDAAIAAYRHALALDGDFAAVRYDLAQLLTQRGDFDEAERELVAALDVVPTYADATLALAALHRVRGRTAAALTLLVDQLIAVLFKRFAGNNLHGFFVLMRFSNHSGIFLIGDDKFYPNAGIICEILK